MSASLKTTAPTIRLATRQDADAIARLASDLGYPTEPETMQRRVRAVLDSPRDLLIVAIDAADRPLAWLQAHAAHHIESGFVVEIIGLVVSAPAQRTGLGRTLVKETEHWATRLEAEAVIVRSNIRRTESHAFYPALGYSATKTQHVYRKRLGSAE